MNTRRKIRVYAVVLAALFALYLTGAILSPRGTVSREPLLPHLREAQPGRILIEADQPIEMIRSEGDWWLAEQTGRYPARSDRIDSLLEELSSARITRRVTENRARFGELGVDDTGAQRMRIYAQSDLGDAAALVDLLWGSRSASGGQYVRREGDDSVIETDAELSFYLNQPSPYWSYLRVLPESATPGQVVVLGVDLGDASYTLQRDAGDTGSNWRFADEAVAPLDTEAVDTLVRAVADLVGRDFYRGELETAEVVGTLRVVLSTGAEFVITLYSVDEGEQVRYVARESRHPVVIATSRFEQLSPTRDELLAASDVQ